MSESKPCRRCGGERSWSDTSKRWRCMPCNYASQLRRKARITAAQVDAERVRANELNNARRAKWTPEQRSAANAQSAAWRALNRDRHRQGTHDWYQRTADERRAAKLAEYYANKEAFYARNWVRKARLADAVCEHGRDCVSGEFLKELAESPCVYCGAPFQHADHFYPIARGGLHCVENIVPACQPCNNSKCARDPFEFIASREGRVC
jgi:hypothetical protein